MANPVKPKSSGGVKGVLTHKLGPAPLWAWAVIAIVGYVLWSKFRSGSSGSNAQATAPASIGSGTSTTGSAPDTSATSGQGSSIDNLDAGLLATLLQQDANVFGLANTAVGSLTTVNSNLVTGLLNSQNVIEGFGTTALNNSTLIEQQILATLPKPGSGSTGGSSGGSSNVNPGGPEIHAAAAPSVSAPPQINQPPAAGYASNAPSPLTTARQSAGRGAVL